MAQLTANLGAYGAGDTEARYSSTLYPTPPVPLGQLGYDALGNEYRFIKAGAAIAANKACTFTGSALGWDSIIATSATLQPVVGVVGTTAFASGDSGWIMRRGVVSAVTTGALAAGVGLATTAVSGQLAAVAATDTADSAGTVLVNSATPQVIYVQGI